MNSMFQDNYYLKSLDVSSFDTSKVTDMSEMFAGCENLIILDLSNFDTSNVTDMSNMFCGCSSLTSLNVSSFDTSKVTNMSYMFRDCSLLETIYVSNKWNTVSVTDSTDMFTGCTSLPGFDSTKIDASMANTNGGYLTLKSV